MSKHHEQQQPPGRHAYLLVVGNSGVEVIGTTFTQFLSGKLVVYGFKDQYRFNPLGRAVVSRAVRWRKDACNMPTYVVEEVQA